MKAVFSLSSVMIIVLLLAQLTLPFFYIQQKRNAFYKEAKKNMKREMAVKIPAKNLLADQNFHWEKEGKEFFYNGGLYDVACMKAENGEYFMYAVPDFAEKAFLKDCAKKDPTSDDGVFSSVPFHLFPPNDVYLICLTTRCQAPDFVYLLPCLKPTLRLLDSPPKLV
jgi:hypothetical protein